VKVSQSGGNLVRQKAQPRQPRPTHHDLRTLRLHWARAMDLFSFGRVAHLDRASASGAEGSGFKSRRAH